MEEVRFAPGELVDGLSRQIKNACLIADPHSQDARDELIDALLRAGELECALEDRKEKMMRSDGTTEVVPLP